MIDLTSENISSDKLVSLNIEYNKLCELYINQKEYLTTLIETIFKDTIADIHIRNYIVDINISNYSTISLSDNGFTINKIPSVEIFEKITIFYELYKSNKLEICSEIKKLSDIFYKQININTEINEEHHKLLRVVKEEKIKIIDSIIKKDHVFSLASNNKGIDLGGGDIFGIYDRNINYVLSCTDKLFIKILDIKKNTIKCEIVGDNFIYRRNKRILKNSKYYKVKNINKKLLLTAILVHSTDETKKIIDRNIRISSIQNL
jgi:hypothetical protein